MCHFSNDKMAKKKSNRTNRSKGSKSQNDEPTTSSLPSTALLSSVFVVFVAMALAGGYHMGRSGVVNNTSESQRDTSHTTSTANASSSATTATVTPSGPEINIATYHDIGDNEEVELTEKQKSDLMTYVSFDDGYAACLQSDSVGDTDMFGVLALKKLKYDFLLKVANRRDFWVAEVPTRADANQLLEAADHLRSMCRLLTLSHEDYEGRAKTVLQKSMDKEDFLDNFSVKSQGNAHDYRTTVCLHRLTDEAFHANAVTKQEKETKTALTKIRYEWAKNITELKKLALAEPPRPMPEGWSVHREEDNGHLFYQNKATGKSSWIRPVPVFGGKGVIVDYPPPAKNGRSVLASTIARKKPCPIEDTIAILTGVPSPNATGDSNKANLKFSSSGGGPNGKKGGIVPDFKVTATGSGGAQFKVTAV